MMRSLGHYDIHRSGGLRENNRVENSHLPIRQRERRMPGLNTPASAQRFLTTHAAVYNTFNVQRDLISRPTLRRFRAEAHAAWTATAQGGQVLPPPTWSKLI